MYNRRLLVYLLPRIPFLSIRGFLRTHILSLFWHVSRCAHERTVWADHLFNLSGREIPACIWCSRWPVGVGSGGACNSQKRHGVNRTKLHCAHPHVRWRSKSCVKRTRGADDVPLRLRWRMEIFSCADHSVSMATDTKPQRTGLFHWIHSIENDTRSNLCRKTSQ